MKEREFYNVRSYCLKGSRESFESVRGAVRGDKKEKF